MNDKNKPEIVESSFLMDMRSVKTLEIKEDPPESIILDDVIKEKNRPKSKNQTYNFNYGDLIVPSTGLNDAFFFKINMNLNSTYTYRKASDAEYVYFMKNIRNSKTKVNNFTEIQEFNKKSSEKNNEK